MNQDGDFAEVLSRYGSLIDRIASSYEAVPAIRQELTQDIALALWRALPGLRDQSATKAFVARIAHNRAVSHVARESRRPRGQGAVEEPVDPADSPEAAVGREMSHARLMQAIRRLPMSQRQVVTLVLEDMSHEDIADVLGISANSSMIRLSRARATLQTLLKDPS